MMVQSPDPYRFMLTQSFVSPSQQETLKHIPGWDDAEFHHSFTPSQLPLPHSQQPQPLQHASIRVAHSDSEDLSSSSSEGVAPAPTTFGIHGPLELVSPDTEDRKEVDSYNAAFESDRSQSPGSSARVWGVPIGVVADLFTAQFETQPGIGAENAFESQPSAFKCFKASNGKHEVAGAPTGQPIVDILAKVKSQGQSIRIKEVAIASDAADMHGKGDSRKSPRKKTAGQRWPKAVQQEPPNLNPSRESSPPAEARDRSNDARSGSSPNGGKSGGNLMTSHSDTKKEPEELAVERAGLILTKQGNSEQDQSRFQDVLAFSKKVASQRKSQKRKQTQSTIQEQETAIKNNLRDNPVEPGKLKETAPTVESPEETRLNTSKQAFGATEITINKIGRIGVAENYSRVTEVKGLDKQQSAKGKDLRAFPESVMDVVMNLSGCLPSYGPGDPDFLSLVMSTGVSLPLPSCRGKGRHL